MSEDVLKEVAEGVFGGAGGLDVEAGRPAHVWKTVVELGWPWVGISDMAGGAGGERADVLALLRAVGAHGVGIPLLETATGMQILAAAGRDISAPRIVAVAGVRPTDAVEYDAAAATVRGRLPAVPWADAADQLIVYAHTVDGVRALLLDRGADGLAVTRDANLAGEPRDTIDLDETPATPLDAAPSATAVLDRIALGVVAQTAGAIETASRLTREHVSTREQFGRPLVRLPMVRSMLAQLAGERELAATALTAAMLDPRSALIAAARITATRASTLVARHAHQLHGAMGTTREHDLHRITRRLWAWRDEWAPPGWWRARLGADVLDRGVDGLWELLTLTPPTTSDEGTV